MPHLFSRLQVYSIALSLVLSGCRFFKAPASLQVQVLDAAGEPIRDAVLMVQKQAIGTSDSRGLIVGDVDLPYGEAVLVEVNKPSSSIFYAPFFESIHLKRGENNLFKIQAILFAVPKSEPQVLAEQNPAPAEPSTPEPAPAAEPGPIQELVPMGLPSTLPADATHANVNANAKEGATGEGEGSLEPSTSNPQMEPAQTGGLDTPPSAFDPQATLEAMNQVESNNRVLTIYVGAGSDLLGNVSILYGDTGQGRWLDGCTTNQRGRCTLAFPVDFQQETVDLLIRAPRFESQKKSVSFAHGDRIRVDLTRGESLEVFAVQRHYQNARGLAGVRVVGPEAELGVTDAFGYFGAPLPSLRIKAPTKVSLLAAGFLPQEVSKEISPLQGLTLVQHYQEAAAPRPRCFLLPLIQTGNSGENQLPGFEKELMDALRQQLLGQAPFAEADLDAVGPLLFKAGLSPLQLARSGWQSSALIGEIEFVLRPQLIWEAQPLIELALIDPRGEIRAAAQARLPLKADARSLRQAMRLLSQELAEQLPFEAAITDEGKDGFRINLGSKGGYRLKVGDKLKLYGSQADGIGQHLNWGEIGKASLATVGEEKSRIAIGEMKSRNAAAIGQTVVIERRRDLPTGASVQLELKDSADQRPVTQANVYFQGQWLGSSDGKGTLRLPSELLRRRGKIEIFRPGYRPLSENYVPGTRQEWTFAMQRDAVPVRIETLPSQALIKLNGRVLGRTPLYLSIPSPGAEGQLEISLGEAYEPFQQTVSIDDDGLDLNGEKAIRLEKNMLYEARNLNAQGRINEAIALLENLPENYPQYIKAQHAVGELYLGRGQNPIKAAAAFHRVTSRPEVANFSDKRYLGSHINEAVALYLAGEQIATAEPKTALSYWQQTIEIMNRTEAQLQYVPQDQYTQALHSLLYYRALSLHRSWAITQMPQDLQRAHLAWKGYIENTALSSPADRNYASLKKAETFYKHTNELLNGQRQALAPKPADTSTQF